jgi:hypothetical protein
VNPPLSAQSNIGESYLTVPVPQALPKPPDVAIEGQVPGGVLLPCTPATAEAGSVVANRNQYRLAFPVQQGTRLSLKRIHLAIPVLVAEFELEKQETTTKSKTRYKTEAEGKEAAEAKGGQPTITESVKPVGPRDPYERQIINTSYLLEETVFVRTTIQDAVYRSVLGTTVTVVARIVGPDGEIWSESFEVPVRWVFGEPPNGNGGGRLDAYADLTNPITVYPDKSYSLALLLFIPSSVKCNAQLGVEIRNNAEVVGEGAVTLFYDVEPVAVGK